MTFDDNANLGGNRVSHRGRNTGLAVGGGGIGVVALVLLSQLLGVDLTGILGGGSGGQPTGTAIEDCDTGADANARTECRMEGAALSLDAFWANELGAEYTEPPFALFDQATTTGCGNATSAVGPFYCPADQTVYIDLSFYNDLQNRFGAEGGPLAEMYVVAHEWGHHIQNITGIMGQAQRGDTGPASDAVRLELQADCFAGAWAGEASTTEDASGQPFLKPITQDQVAQALDAASVIGDDRIQEQTQGQVNPESWTHGSSESRQKWFRAGFENGTGACDTFAAPADQL
ncbi:neutral zinc metallopeptidase [Diaminobutyricimonas sp. LJ205]|uniref:KPN_02809 family neutral zinc metallopeptidase n=1 Tax=Diaminobutyricimonas sp. LJ205 TaxID=2683590 RepID=UPI0012F4E702|nr:neutral zinc metallopeptidase [Diaminobutyricimonas sp. LJ205]